MEEILSKAAKMLVKCGYAKAFTKRWETDVWYVLPKINSHFRFQKEANPFSDTLEGRRQADAIEDWFEFGSHRNKSLWWDSQRNKYGYGDNNKPSLHQWRLDRIKWCLAQLINK